VKWLGLAALLCLLAAAAVVALALLNCWVAGGFWVSPFVCWGMG
jgi:hypothetical protein